MPSAHLCVSGVSRAPRPSLGALSVSQFSPAVWEVSGYLRNCVLSKALVLDVFLSLAGPEPPGLCPLRTSPRLSGLAQEDMDKGCRDAESEARARPTQMPEILEQGQPPWSSVQLNGDTGLETKLASERCSGSPTFSGARHAADRAWVGCVILAPNTPPISNNLGKAPYFPEPQALHQQNGHSGSSRSLGCSEELMKSGRQGLRVTPIWPIYFLFHSL